MNRKPRKRTNSNVPSKGRLREMADALWSRAIRDDWANRCAVCGSTKTKVEAHHLVPRQHEATRYELLNGIALCARHHQFDRDLSPHQNAAGWIAWLNRNHRERAEWYIDNRRPVFTGVKNAAYYIDVINRLREYVDPLEFEGIVGVTFSQWLEENPVDENAPEA